MISLVWPPPKHRCNEKRCFVIEQERADYGSRVQTSQGFTLQYMIQHFLEVVTKRAQLSNKKCQHSHKSVQEDGIATLKFKALTASQHSQDPAASAGRRYSYYSYLLCTLTANFVHNSLLNDRVSGFAGPLGQDVRVVWLGGGCRKLFACGHFRGRNSKTEPLHNHAGGVVRGSTETSNDHAS